jgi:hypothetical protein
MCVVIPFFLDCHFDLHTSCQLREAHQSSHTVNTQKILLLNTAITSAIFSAHNSASNVLSPEYDNHTIILAGHTEVPLPPASSTLGTVKVFISDTIQHLSPKKKCPKISEIQPLSPIPFLAQQNLDDTIPTDIPSATTHREVEYF